MTLPNINIVETTPGTIRVRWTQDPEDGNSTTLDNGSEVCNLTFKAIGLSRCGRATELSIGTEGALQSYAYPNVPVTIETVSGQLELCYGKLTIQAEGGLRNNQFDPYVAVPISVKNFYNVLSLEFTVEFDNTLWAIDSVTSNLPDAIINYPPNTAEGTLTFSWEDVTQQGLTYADDYEIFAIQFLSLGVSDCEVTSPIAITSSVLPITATNLTGSIPTQTIPGTLEVCIIEDTGGGSDGSSPPIIIKDLSIEIVAPAISTAPLQLVDVEFKVRNFLNIKEFQFTINFDPVNWEYMEMTFINSFLPNFGYTNFDVALASTGKITVHWINPFDGNSSIYNNTTLFTMSLRASEANSCGQVTQVYIDGSVLPIMALEARLNSSVNILSNTAYLEVCDLAVPVGSDTNSVELFLQTPFITGTGSGQSTILYPEGSPESNRGCMYQNEFVDIKIIAVNFVNIRGIQFALEYNPDLFVFDDYIPEGYAFTINPLVDIDNNPLPPRFQGTQYFVFNTGASWTVPDGTSIGTIRMRMLYRGPYIDDLNGEDYDAGILYTTSTLSPSFPNTKAVKGTTNTIVSVMPSPNLVIDFCRIPTPD